MPVVEVTVPGGPCEPIGPTGPTGPCDSAGPMSVAVVCVVPSGNSTPPDQDRITPFTSRLADGSVVPIPTRCLSGSATRNGLLDDLSISYVKKVKSASQSLLSPAVHWLSSP